MLRLDLVDRLRRRQERREYRRQLAAALAAEPWLGALPRLRTLPIHCLREDGRVCAADDIADAGRSALLRGAPGSGRSLIVAQLAHAWLSDQSGDGPAPLPVDLAALDDGASSPTALLTSLTYAVDRERGRHAPADVEPRWWLLASGWEELPRERAELWRLALTSAAVPHTVGAVLVVAPEAEPAWPGFTTLTRPAPEPAEVDAWLAHLAPGRAPAEVRAELAGVDPEAPLMEWVAALAVQSGGWVPAGRADRLGRALALLEDSPPRGDAPQALGTGAARAARWHALALADARAAVESGAFWLLAEQPPSRRDGVALLAASMCYDTGPLVAGLLPAARRDQRLLVTLGRCVRERAPQSPAATLLVVRGLGRLARGRGPLGEEAARALEGCLPAFDEALGAAMRRRAFRIAQSALAALPEELAAPRLALLACAPDVPEAFGWRMVDWLAALACPLPEVEMPEEGPGVARWAYLQAIRSAAELSAGGRGAARALAALAGADRGRRERAAAALLMERSLPSAVRLGALALVDDVRTAWVDTLLERLCADPAREVRIAALRQVQRRDPQRALALHIRAASDGAAGPEARFDAIELLGRARSARASETLMMCAGDDRLPLHMRLAVVRLLAARRGGRARLLAIVRSPSCAPAVRAAAALSGPRRRAAAPGPRGGARQLRRTRRPGRRADELLLRVACDPSSPGIVARAACAALARRGPRAIPLLGQALERSAADVELSFAAVSALGATRGEAAVPLLAELLGSGAVRRLRRAIPAALLRVPSAEALEGGELPPAVARRLVAVTDACLTPADRPTTLSELAVQDADALRAAAADALAAIGGAEASRALVRALVEEDPTPATPAVAAALGRLAGPRDAAPLGAVLLDPRTSLRTRWLAAEQLAAHPEGVRTMMEGLLHPELDPFTRAALGEALGRRRVGAALTPLSAIARDTTQDTYLRERALAAIGALADPSGDALLVALACDQAQDPLVRGAAAGALGPHMAPECRHALRSALREEQPPAELIVGALRALGAARDREALPLLIQYSLDQRSAVVLAAVDGLSASGDPGVASVLVGITQSPAVERVIRLHAIGALLRLGGEEHEILLRSYLSGQALPLQLQALEQLVRAEASPAQLLALLADRDRPLPFRLRVFEAVAPAVTSAGPLAPILADVEEPPQLRGRVARRLGAVGGPVALEALVAGARRGGDHLGVRLACIAALAARADAEAVPALGALAEGQGEPATVRAQAAAAALASLRLVSGV